MLYKENNKRELLFERKNKERENREGDIIQERE